MKKSPSNPSNKRKTTTKNGTEFITDIAQDGSPTSDILTGIANMIHDYLEGRKKNRKPK